MPTFLVRHRKTERSFGIFAVSGLAELIELVGRVAVLADCDYATVGSDPLQEGSMFTAFPADNAGVVANDP